MCSMLPLCTKIIDKPYYFENSKYKNTLEFHKVLSELISADCHALVIDSDIIFNSYDCSNNKLHIITNNMTRKFLYENPDEICFIAKHSIDIYMHSDKTILYKILISNGDYDFIYFTKNE